MTAPEGEPSRALTEHDLRRAWRSVTAAGMVGIAYFSFCILEVPRVRFLTELGATAFDFGLISSLACLAVGFQVLAAFAINRVRRRKALWMTVVIIHRLLFAAVLVAPALFTDGRIRIWWIIAIIFIHDCLLQFSAPVWLSWMGDLLPGDRMNELWANRLRWVTGANIVTAVAAAFIMGYFEAVDQVIVGFIMLATAGIIFGVIDALMFIRVPEPPNEREPEAGMFAAMMQPLRDREYRPFLFFMLVWNFTMMLAGPFFIVYMVNSLKMPALYAQLAGTAGLLGVAFSSPFWGLVCDTYGNRPVLRITLLTKTITIVGFIFTPPDQSIVFPVLSLLLFFDGVTNAGIMLAINGIMFQASPRRNRASYIATINFLSVGLAGGIAPVFAGKIIDLLDPYVWAVGPYRFNGYHLMFALSGVTRFIAWWLAERVPTYRKVSTRATVAELWRHGPMWARRRILLLQRSRSADRRARAARELGERRVVLGLTSLIRALEDPAIEVRHEAATALGLIGRDEATAALAQALWDPASGIHSPAARALGRIGGFKPLRILLRHVTRPDAIALGDAIEALAHIGDTSAVLPLICLLDETRDENLRNQIAGALRTLSHASTEQEVMALFETTGRPGAPYDFV